MCVTSNNQVNPWRCWSRWLPCFLAILSAASLAEGQESGKASSVGRHQQSTSHPLRFFQRNKTTNKLPNNDNREDGTSSTQPSLATLPIQQPSLNRQSRSDDLAERSTSSTTQAMTTIFGALAIVLGIFFLVVWLTRSANQRRWSPLPNEAVQLLGRTPLAGRQWMQLIRVGNKLVMVSVNGNQVDTITEITDPEEVEQLVSLCHKNQASHFRQTFQQVLDQHRQHHSQDTASRSPQHAHPYFTSTG